MLASLPAYAALLHGTRSGGRRRGSCRRAGGPPKPRRGARRGRGAAQCRARRAVGLRRARRAVHRPHGGGGRQHSVGVDAGDDRRLVLRRLAGRPVRARAADAGGLAAVRHRGPGGDARRRSADLCRRPHGVRRGLPVHRSLRHGRHGRGAGSGGGGWHRCSAVSCSCPTRSASARAVTWPQFVSFAAIGWFAFRELRRSPVSVFHRNARAVEALVRRRR